MTITASLTLHRPRVGGALLKLGAAVMGGPIFFREERSLKQQSRRRCAANGFAFVPYTYRFLGRQSLGCRTGGEEMRLHLRPKGRRGDPVRPKKNSASADALKRKLTALGSRGRRGA